MQTLSTKKKSNSREMPWNRYRDSTVGRNRCWKMLVRMALGSSSIISCCFKRSVLNWRHICDNIWSFSLGGRWFRLTKFEAACMLFLCQKSEPNLVYRTYNFPWLQSTNFVFVLYNIIHRMNILWETSSVITYGIQEVIKSIKNKASTLFIWPYLKLQNFWERERSHVGKWSN